MKETVLQQIQDRLEYIIEIEKFQSFWNTNREYVEKLIAFYFTFQNTQNYIQNKKQFDDMVYKVMTSDIQQLREMLIKLKFEIESEDYVDKYMELLNKQLLNSQIQHQTTLLQNINSFNENLDVLKVVHNEITTSGSQQIFHEFNQAIRTIPQEIQSLSQILLSIEFFDLLKNKGENLVLIGANGSGKSTFSRQIKKNIAQQFTSFVAVIPAQKIFNVIQNNSIPLKTKAFSDFSQSHKHDKLVKDSNDIRFITNEFTQIINCLIAEHQEVANSTHVNYENSGFTKRNSLLENVITVWESIISHIKLRYDGQGNIEAVSENGNTYNFMALSDGEKSIFYCIASVLLVDKDGYIIVDEPENHLHMSIVNKLWDKLESIRSDCQFVYLTHNPSFATGRTNAKILWIKKYIPPSNWDYEEIPTDEILPQQLMVELIGSKKKILFCEGERDSYDYKLYSVLFRNYTVMPVGGHQKAIDYCRAFNENQKLSNFSAIAIIDKDFYEDEELKRWKEDDIYTLDVMEIENILCDEEVLKVVQSSVHATAEEYSDAKKQIFSKIEETKDKQSMEYARFKTDKILSSLVGKSGSPTELKTQLENAISLLDPKSFYDEHKQLLQDICDKEDYDEALRFYNNKGMLSFVGDRILKGYKDRVISFIKNNEELQKKLVDKYFSDIPAE